MDIIEYTTKNNKTFAETPFNHMDALVLSQLTYCRFEAAFNKPSRIKEFFMAEYFDAYFNDGITDRQNKELLAAVSCSKRYRDIIIEDIAEDTDKESGEQFAAIVFRIDDGIEFIGFRGTDGTMVGWKEDCMLAFENRIPAQLSAMEFLDKRGTASCDKRFILSGHSKGGNLAIFAAAFCDESVKRRIDIVFSLDGPGFLGDVSEEIDNVLNKTDMQIQKIVPHDSVVGMLLEGSDDYQVIKTETRSIMQHSIYNWTIENNDLCYLDSLSLPSIYLDRTMRDWFTVATVEQRKIFVETMFRILEHNNIQVISDFQRLRLKEVVQMLKELRMCDDETSQALETMITSLVKAAARQLTTRD